MIAAIRGWWQDESEMARFGFAGIVVAAAVARAAALAQPMRYDESVAYLTFIGQPWRAALAGYRFPNDHLLYLVAAKLTAAIGGGAAWALRLPAFVAGLAVVPLTYAVGRALYSRTAAFVGCALSAVATPLVLYSANARGYSTMVAAYLVLLLLAARIRSAGGSARRWVAFALVAAAGMATIPVMLYPLGAVALWLTLTLVAERRRRAVLALLSLVGALVGAAALTLVAYLPITHGLGLTGLAADMSLAASSWPTFFRALLPDLGLALASWGEPYPALVALLLAAAAIVGAARSVRVSREGVSVLMAAGVWSAVLLVVTRHLPAARTWIWMLPVAGLAVGAAAELTLRRPRAARATPFVPLIAAAAAVAGIAWGFTTDALGQSTDTGVFVGARAVALALVMRAQPSDRVVASIPADGPLRYYLLRAGADTALLSTPDSATMREIIVLDARYHQTVPWAISVGLIDTAHFGPVAPAMHAPDADVYVAERKGTER
jgi:hypothetical protein